jgi:hypothetical protein
MRFTLSWLKDHLETEADVHRIAEAMTMAGLEPGSSRPSGIRTPTGCRFARSTPSTA